MISYDRYLTSCMKIAGMYIYHYFQNDMPDNDTPYLTNSLHISHRGVVTVWQITFINSFKIITIILLSVYFISRLKFIHQYYNANQKSTIHYLLVKIYLQFFLSVYIFNRTLVSVSNKSKEIEKMQDFIELLQYHCYSSTPLTCFHYVACNLQ